MINYKEHRDEVFRKRPGIKKAYDEMEAEYALIQRMIDQRAKHGMTQTDLARKVGTKQSAISRFEAGGSNPTVAFLYKIADALDAQLHVTLTPLRRS